jgi:hypothetical protein
MHRAPFIAAIISLAFASSAFAAGEPTAQAHSGGLTCFSINPPGALTDGKPSGPRMPPSPVSLRRETCHLHGHYVGS